MATYRHETMSDTSTAAPAAAPSAPTSGTRANDDSRTYVTLDDGPTTPTVGAAGPTMGPATSAGPAATANTAAGTSAGAATTTPAATKSPEALRAEAEALVLDLGKRGRALAEREKGLTRAEAELKSFRELRQLAQTDPLGFAERMAVSVGLDRAKLVEAWTVSAAGGTPKLSDADRLARLEADRAAERAAADKRAEDERKAREDAEADAAVTGHVTALKGIAVAKAAEFPLVSRRLETGSVAAFDLMVLHHNAGQPLTHEAALRLVEDQLRADAEADAQVLGYAKSAAQPTSPTAFAVTPPSGAGNSTHAPADSAGAGAAPFEPVAIKSDEDIAREWRAMFSRAA